MPRFRVYGTRICEDMFEAIVTAKNKTEAKRKVEEGEYDCIDFWTCPKNTNVVGDVEEVRA